MSVLSTPPGFVYVFLHLQRTGGTTINAHLHQNLAWDVEFIHLGGWGDQYRSATGRTPPEERSVEERARVRIVAGHRAHLHMPKVLPDAAVPRYLTILRDPADRIASIYNYLAAREEVARFWDWYETYPRDVAYRWLRKRLGGSHSVKDVLDTLRDFWFVGTTDHLDDDLPDIFRAIGVPGVWTNRRVAGAGQDLSDLDHPDANRHIPRLVVVDEEIRNRIHSEHERDLRLYRFALRRRSRMQWERP